MTFTGNPSSKCLFIVSLLLLLSCKQNSENKDITINTRNKIERNMSILYAEPFRPQFHFSPKKNR